MITTDDQKQALLETALDEIEKFRDFIDDLFEQHHKKFPTLVRDEIDGQLADLSHAIEQLRAGVLDE